MRVCSYCLCLLALAWRAAAGGVAGSPPFEEKRLGVVPANVTRTFYGPNGRHVAMLVRTDGGERVDVDGQTGKTYDAVGQKPIPGSGAGGAFGRQLVAVVFSPDGNRIAYPARLGQVEMLVVDGREGPVYDSIKFITFSRDSQHVAYVADKANKQMLVVDGKEGPAYSGIYLWYIAWESPFLNPGLAFSADATHVAYLAGNYHPEGNDLLLVVDGKEEPIALQGLRELFPMVVSEDGKHTAYAVKTSQAYVVHDGRKGPEYFGVGLPVLSPDGLHLAYTASRESRGNSFLVVDGKEQEMGGGRWIRFSPDSQHLASSTVLPDRTGAMVLDGKMQRSYDSVEWPVFSPDSQRLAYEAAKGNAGITVLDGVELPGAASLAFSPDSKRVAYFVANGDGKVVATADGQRSQPYDRAASVVIDRLGFRPDGTLEFIGIRDGVIWRVTKQPPGPTTQPASK
jgi:hypothetical protein